MRSRLPTMKSLGRLSRLMGDCSSADTGGAIRARHLAGRQRGKPRSMTPAPNEQPARAMRLRSMLGQRRIRFRAAFMSSGSRSPLVNDPSLFSTPRKLKRRAAMPCSAAARHTAVTMGASMLPPSVGWGWHITSAGYGWGRSAGVDRTPSRANLPLLNWMAVWRIIGAGGRRLAIGQRRGLLGRRFGAGGWRRSGLRRLAVQWIWGR